MADMLHREVSLGEMLIESLTSDTSRPVLMLEDGAVISAGTMVDRIDRYLGAFEKAGIRAGDRVAVLSRNRPEVAEITGAFMVANIVMVPLHPMGSLEDYIFAINDTGATALVFEGTKFSDVVGEITIKMPDLNVLAIGTSLVGLDLLALVAKAEPDRSLRVQPRPEDISRILMTGGTTGRPKSILLNQRAMTTMLMIQQSTWDWPSELRALICTPMSHSGIALMMPALLRGGWMKMMSSFDVEEFMETVQTQRITCTLLVPTMIYALMDHPKRNEYDLSSLECIYYGASSINPLRLKEAIRMFGSIFFQFYGQSEAPLSVTVLNRKDHVTTDLLRLSSCGKPVPWVRVKLLDDDGNEVPVGSPGEICCQGPLVMDGYIGVPEQNLAALSGGWLHTGDIAVKDADGFFRIIDRKKDMIISGGFNVFPREVEDVLESHDAVKQASVVGLPDEKWGERVAAMVVLREGQSVSEDDLRELVKRKKGPVQAPKEIVFSRSIPLSQVGKPDKKAVKAAMLEWSAVLN